MKRRLLSLICALAITLGTPLSLTACGGDNPPDPPANEMQVEAISSDLLDGKIANFLGAQGFGLLDKNQVQTPAQSGFSAVGYNSTTEKQKKQEFSKDTGESIVDVHFHDANQEIKDYKDLNEKNGKHHHDGVECVTENCTNISDEVIEKETAGFSKTVVSLDARVNKLYNYGDFTFMSISSAVEGEVTVYTHTTKFANEMLNNYENLSFAPTPVNMEDHVAEGSPWSYSYISIPATEGREIGFIPVKKYVTETGYHTANYWSDDYNQSYIIDNKTGKTYSLAQFPYIYSVKTGVIKVFNKDANGMFDYYLPKVVNGEMTFEKVQLPTDFNIPIGVNAVKTDIYGHIIIETGSLGQGSSFDEYGEKRYGNVILSVIKQETKYQITQITQIPKYGELFARRYANARKYHLGSDGRIYRLDFKGNFSEIKVQVLNQAGVWQEVENNIEVEFESFTDKFISFKNAMNATVNDEFLITKISNGYAYYSTAAHTDGITVWESNLVDGSAYEYGDYAGVVKIPTTGAVVDENTGVYEHLNLLYNWRRIYGADFMSPYKAFLLGETQVDRKSVV